MSNTRKPAAKKATPQKKATPKKPAPKLKLRLVEVVIQPVVMIDDGTSLRPIEHQPVAIPADLWPTYSSERFPQELAAWEAHINAEAAAQADGTEEESAR